jgi:hypothetical protein
MSVIDKVLDTVAVKLMTVDSLTMLRFAVNRKQVNNGQK